MWAWAPGLDTVRSECATGGGGGSGGQWTRSDAMWKEGARCGGGGWTRDKALVPEGKAKEEEDEEGRALPQRSRVCVSTNTLLFYNGRDCRAVATDN